MTAGGMVASAYRINGEPVDQARFQDVACDPRRHVVVEACAGAGKTWLLVERMVRALEQGCEPHEILAITFTRKAAGEMRERLDRRLREGAPQLYARLLEHGRPPQIRTFHSWFAQLLGVAPLAVLAELGLPLAFELLEDDSLLVAQVWRRFHDAVLRDAGLKRDFEALVQHHGRHSARQALEKTLAKRIEFARTDAAGRLDESVPPVGRLFAELVADGRDEAGPPDSSPDRWLDGARVREPLLEAAAVLGRGGKTAQRAAGDLVQGLDQRDLGKVFTALFTKQGTPRKLGDDPTVLAAQAVAVRLRQAVAQRDAREHHQRLVRLGRVLLAEYAALKRERQLVDMSDVELAAHRMLSDEVLGAWMQERLDARVRHLLIDEFQDTNPMQWQALVAWLSAYAGAGGGPQGPGVFIVGDPKQSIYRFRRAEPRVFRAAREFVRDTLGGDLLSTDHTWRCAPAVIEVVNQVMSAAQDAGEYSDFRPHTARAELSGAVLALPLIERPSRAGGAAGTPADDGPADAADEAAANTNTDAPADAPAAPQDLAWRDSLLTPRQTLEEGLRTRESRQVAGWIGHALRQGAQAADFMILARQRDRLRAVADELRQLGIAHAYAETHPLIDAPEVQDLVALMDALVSPGHDLSLARALRSPLFGLDDAALIRLALLVRSSPGACWLEVIPQAGLCDAAGRPVHAVLSRWQGWLQTLPPHDALQAIYHDGDVLARYAAALPQPMVAQALRHLRALIDASLRVEGGRYLGAYELIRALRRGEQTVPAVVDPAAVRLLTIHGAKGLEAPHVVLLDTDAASARAETLGALIDWPAAQAWPRAMAFFEREGGIARSLEDLLAQERAGRQREELNALYVAMTRARQTLVLSAVQAASQTVRAGSTSWWHRLSGMAAAVAVPADSPEPDGPTRAATHPSDPADAQPPRVLLDIEPWSGGTTRQPGPSQPPAQGEGPGEAPADDLPARRGQMLHRLLEWSPPPGPGSAAGLAQAWPTPAQVHAAAAEFALGADAAADVAAQAVAMRSGEVAWAWDPAVVDWADNEVEIIHQGRRMRLDRLVRRREDGRWWVLDYKSALQPQAQEAYLTQLRLYRQALGAVKGAGAVTAALVAADGRVIVVE